MIWCLCIFNLFIILVVCVCLIILLIVFLKIIDNIDCFVGFNDLVVFLLLNLKCRLVFCNKCFNDEILFLKDCIFKLLIMSLILFKVFVESWFIVCILFFVFFGLVFMSLIVNLDFKVRLVNICFNVLWRFWFILLCFCWVISILIYLFFFLSLVFIICLFLFLKLFIVIINIIK